MKYSTTSITTTQAAALSGRTARTITNMINSGKLSATRVNGNFIIEKSELFRVFPKGIKKEKESNSSILISENNRLEMENCMLKELCSQKEKEVEFMRSLVETNIKEKQRLLDAINSHMKLLEHKRDPTVHISWMDKFRRK